MESRLASLEASLTGLQQRDHARPSSWWRLQCGERTMNTFADILPFLKPIEHLILDDSISEVMVNGPRQVFVERDGVLQEVPYDWPGEGSLLVAVKNIARCLGGEISESKPILDSRFPDGSRVAAVIPPCSLCGVTLTIRKFNVRQFGIADLILAGMLDATLAKRLEEYVLGRKNILISGSAGAGKTTLISMLARFIPDDERILLFEDRAEIHITQKNVLRFEPKEIQNGLGPTTMRDLLEAAIGHRPDRIVVGDIHGGEAFDLLELMNAGHSGTLTAVQANGALQALSRFMSCALRRGANVPYRALKHNLGDSLNVVIHVERRPGRRYISEVFEINCYDPDSDLFDYCAIYLN